MVDNDPYATDAPLLPTWLREAVDTLEDDTFFPKAFGEGFVDYLIQMKRAELARYEAAIAENPPPGRAGRQRLGDARVLRVLLRTKK